jgi:hypothetical protein
MRISIITLFIAAFLPQHAAAGVGPLYASDYGVVCDDATNNTAAFAIALAAFPASGGTLILPPGICKGVLSITGPVQLTGQGYGYLSPSSPTGTCGTEIRSDGADDNIITLLGAGSGVHDLCVTSSVPVASRTGAGVYISAPITNVSRIYSYAHKYGFELSNNGGGNLEDSLTTGDQSHGVYQTGANNELHYINVQSNGNGGDGFHLEGSGLGFHLTDITAASNAGGGIFVTGVTDVYITQPELSSNHGNNIYLLQTGAVSIVNDFNESSGAAGLNIQASNNVTYSGGFNQCNLVGVQVYQSHDVTITGHSIQSNAAANLVYAAGNARVSISGNVIGNGTCTSSAPGVRFDASSPALSMVGNDFENLASKILGSMPGGSVCTGLNLGLSC